MNKTPHVIIDLDDCLGDFWGAWLEPFNKKFGTNIEKHQLTDYNKFTDDFGITYDDFLGFLREERHRFLDIEVNSHIKRWLEVMHDLQSDNTLPRESVFHAITSRGYMDDALEITNEWLDKVGVSKYIDKVSISGNGVKKSDRIQDDECVICFIDDHMDNILDVVDNCHLHPEYMMMIVDQPWNRHHDINSFDFLVHRIYPTPDGMSE